MVVVAMHHPYQGTALRLLPPLHGVLDLCQGLVDAEEDDEDFTINPVHTCRMVLPAKLRQWLELDGALFNFPHRET